MPTDVVSLLISFMAVAVAGAAAYFSWKVPMALREEKFKEIIYARRLAIYDDVLVVIAWFMLSVWFFLLMYLVEV